ncbi:ABC transporter substrate-binding protein [Streptomyces endophyticus]|uniref:ABC transporter substrate-binding protein n=1 Tax=Streptomyces endophyticus TaxID=714166 RepID=A0ABU6F240_9ACTN|nr:ABC transporter substrate-binding protein [Streptomyces endophyticus]MEB8338073.1 ABC transporter substrate-binding protein [Streptomyces endophyticus]
MKPPHPLRRPHRPLRLRRLLLGLPLLLLATACGTGEAATSLTARPAAGATLTYATDREPTCLDPHVAGDMPQAYVAQQVLDSLVALDDKGEARPWLATAWDISKDGRTYTFHLRDDVRFTDGTRFDAAAVKANFDHMVDPDTQSGTAGGYLAPYQKTDVVDAFTARVHLDRPYSPFLNMLAQAFLGMESPKALARGKEANCAAPVGTGPFLVKKWNRQSDVVLVRNPRYNSPPPYAKHKGPAYVDKVVWRFIPEPATRFAAVQSGQVDVIDALPPEDQRTAEHDERLKVAVRDRPGNPTNLALNTARTPFDDLRVRKAFLHSADVADGLKSVFFGQYRQAGGPLSYVTPHYKDAYENAWPYDPKKANTLLDQAGWSRRDGDGYRVKDGRRLTAEVLLKSDISPNQLALMEQIQATAKDVGFQLKLLRLDAATVNTRYLAGSYDLRDGYWNTNTPDVLHTVFGSEYAVKGGIHSNASYSKDPALDRLFRAAQATTDPNEQQKLYAAAQRLISAGAYQLTLYPQTTRLAAHDASVRGAGLEPALSLPYLYDTWVSSR